MFTKIYEWIVWSSTNAEKWSLTAKAFVGGTALLGLLSMFGIVLPTDDISSLVDQIVLVLQAIATASTAVVTAYGLLRKIVKTVKGENDLLNKYYSTN